MSSVWRCPTCSLEGDAPLWTRIKTQAGERLGCIRCAGRLKLVPLGAADLEAQAYLEAHHVLIAMADAENQQRILDEAESRRATVWTDAVSYEIYGPQQSEALNAELAEPSRPPDPA